MSNRRVCEFKSARRMLGTLIRPQYHFRPSAHGFFAWDVRRLVALAQACETEEISLSVLGELDENWWFQEDGMVPSARRIAEHVARAEAADLAFPIILDADGRLMDGMHRVLKALMQGHERISAVRLTPTPEPDYQDVQPNELSYE